MSRPQLIRADTIDLQDQTSPSAQDHTRQPTHPGALGAGPPAPHQAETLREVAAEAEEEQHRNPRVSNDWPNGEQHFGSEASSGSISSSVAAGKLQQQDASAVAQNGGLTGAEDADMADAEGDDGMDDDMMDKISSSPSIDDGGYSLPQWPERFDSLFALQGRCTSQAELVRSSSPFVKTPDHYPLNFIDSTPHREGSPERTFKSDSSSCSQPAFHSEGSSEQSTPACKSNSSYLSEQCDVLGPLPGDFTHDFVDSYNEEVEEPSFGGLSKADFESYFEASYDESQFTIPYESSEDEYDDIVYPEDRERFVDSGWGGECLQNSEDIDFEFVYALHTFVATVEGQANATKGDTMVLLDDSNSYWWLVRVVKDSSIGYLPAEHIETPTERLARLNKHRNIDLSASMLGDQGEKSKNPLKKAIRRRNAKTVTFSAPTYVEASDVDYSTDEEGDAEFYAQDQQQKAQQSESSDQQTAVEPLSEMADVKDVDPSVSELALRKSGDNASKASSETLRNSDEIFDGKVETSGKSRNGTVRNTDSFFKDDTVETRKITLTPNLLRDDSSASTTRTSNDSKELRQRPSIDKVEKDQSEKSKDDKKKKDKREKDKKPGMLSNLFSRKKKKLQDDDIDELIYGKKVSGEDARASPAPSNDSEELVAEEPTQRQSSPQRQPSKLQKQPRLDASSTASTKLSNLTSEVRPADTQQTPAPERALQASLAMEPSMRMVRAESQEPYDDVQNSRATPELNRGVTTQNSQGSPKSENPLSKILRARSSSNSDSKPEKVKKAKVRSELDDFDSSVESSPIEGPVKNQIRPPVREAPIRPSIPGAYPDSYTSTPAVDRSNPMDERLSESPVHVSPIDPSSRSNPPALMVDTSSQEGGHSPSSSPSPELVDADEVREKKSSEHSISTPTSTSTWSDAHLRTFFDDDQEIKDLLVVVYDKSGVVPAGPDHPITGNLFKEESAKLADITNRLDGMLGDWLARKSKVAGR